MIIKAILLATVAAATSFLLSHAEIFVSLRVFLRKRSDFFGQLIDCCYCLGHWITAALLVFMPVALFEIFRPLDYILTWIVISWLAGILSMATSWLWGEK